ncbi:MAG: hypothetical protein NTU51_01485 [Bacteroidetes bacterium]|nr:hypothetical protein [Bacteroidota bacterium]
MAKKKPSSYRKTVRNDQKRSVLKGNKQTQKNIYTGNTSATAGLFIRLETFLSGRMNFVLYASMLATLLSGILLFDIRFSLAGDDSAYVARASDFVRHFIFPSFQGPLYPIILSPFVAIFGISSIPLKSLSLVFMMAAVLFFFKAFRQRISPVILTISLFLLSVNPFLLYYSSQTYTEAFFMFLQAFTLYVFFKYFIDEGGSESFKKLALKHLILAACVLSLGLTRPIGFASIMAIPAYFMLKAQWKNIVYFILAFILLLLIFLLAKTLIWGNSGLLFSSQAGGFLAKDYYNPGGGREDISGFIDRLCFNSNYYISQTVYVFLGLRATVNATQVYTWLTLLTVLIFGLLMIMVFRKNAYLLFTGIYILISLTGIFLITQVIWIQDRYIISYFPLILLLLTAFFYYLFWLKGLTRLQIVLPLLAIIPFISSIRTLATDIQQVREIKDNYSGLSPDWENYCRISAWAAENLPPGTLVACRKPSVSFIYGKGKNFYGINRIVSMSGDSLLQNWKQKNQHCYFILTSSLVGRSLPDYLYYSFKYCFAGYGLIKTANSVLNPVYIMSFPESSREKTLQMMKVSQVAGTDNMDTLHSWLKDSRNTISYVFPDTLLAFLRAAGVTHVIMANLRADGQKKDGNTNNTVELFMDYIRFKYPGIMTKIVQVGANDNEPATLYKINYDQAVVNMSQ